MSKHQAAFDKFHATYPEVYDMFVRFTFEKIRQGYQNYSSRVVLERVRWETDAGADLFGGDEPFKINNNFQPYYARKFHADYPNFDGFFRTRRMQS